MRYEYKHDLEDDELYQKEPLIRAAFKVAERAHKNQSRKKEDPSIGYITHPIMVYKILRKMGETDPSTLAAALLHDVLEDDEYYPRDHNALATDLFIALRTEGHPDFMDSAVRAIDILEMCEQVKNKPNPDEGKVYMQVDKAPELDFTCKKLKIADQLASLIDNLTMANDPAQFTFLQEEHFTNKAWNVVDAILRSVYQQKGKDNSIEKRIMEKWENIFGITLYAVQELLAATDRGTKESIRDSFDFNALFTTKTRLKIVEVPHIAKTLSFELKAPRPNFGAIRVDLDKSGEVVGYALQVDAGHNYYSNVLQLQERLVKALAEKNAMSDRRFSPIQAGPASAVDSADDLPDSKARVFHLNRPLNAHVFASAVWSIGACSIDDKTTIESHADALKEGKLIGAKAPAKKEAMSRRFPRIFDGPSR